MTTKYASFIKALREKRNLSQQEISGKLGISRSSYISVEQGKRELSLNEAEALAGVFGISLNGLMNTVAPNYEKYRQMIFTFLRLSGTITKTKLAKLLYFADFGWFYYHLHSMSGMQYRKMQYGPVAESYFAIIDDMLEKGEVDIDTTKDGAMLVSQTRSGAKTHISMLGEEEKKLIKDIEKKWKNKKTVEVVDFTHKQFPYLFAQDNEVVSYALFTQEDPDDIY